MFSSFKKLFSGNDIQQLSPKDVIDLDPESYVIVDVREKWELEIVSLAGAVHIPLGALHHRLHELDNSKQIIVLCHHGGRSQRAAVALANEGFKNIANLAGGIDKWATTIDTTLRRY